MQYFFILGRQPELSIAELTAVFERDNIQCKLTSNNYEYAVFDLKKEINANALINKLGGTIKIGQIIETATKTELAETIESLLPETDKKLIFGINDYTGKNKPINLSKQIKKSAGRSMRFVYPQAGAKYLSSVATEKNKLLTPSGIEFNLFNCHPDPVSHGGGTPGTATEITSDSSCLDLRRARRAPVKRQGRNDNDIPTSTILIGKTLAVQPFEKFSKFDYDRPSKDAESGMLPPKVATIMLNLSGAKTTDTLLDPFCGSGTILQQALLLGFKKVTGTDVSEKAVEDSIDNIAWLEKQIGKKLKVQIERLDVRQLEKEIAHNSIGAIVTEPFLGKPIWGNEPIEAIEKQIFELENFYAAALKQLVAALKPRGSIVIIIPSFAVKNRLFKINATKLFDDAGLKTNGRWQYSRPGQHVIRNIYRLTK